MNHPVLVWLPLGFHEWLPSLQAATLGLMTFVQEDVPTVSAALLASAGKLAWSAGFLGCFLGIWLGDALLYLLARGLGRPLLQRAWARRFFDAAAVARSERWFADRGTWLLWSSRFVPGSRLPTYLAAGFLRLPFGRFLLVTGTAVGVWTVGIFGLASAYGPDLIRGLQRWNAGGWAFLGAIVAGALLLRALPRMAQRRWWQRAQGVVGRWRHWEFWPAWLFYAPVALHYLRLAMRHRGFTVPTAANPGMFSGGFVGESKFATLRDLAATSPEFTAEAFLLPWASDATQPEASGPGRITVLEALRVQHGIRYPFILKPDQGQRGVGVKLIRTPAQAAEYVRHMRADLLLQRYAAGPKEVGVFYHRFPGQDRGQIFAITEKIFPTVTGDGRRTVEDLIWRDRRARIVAGKYLARLGERAQEVPHDGEEIRLVQAGNHAQGCIFRDGAWLKSDALERRIDEISRKLDGFFIGRYDIRYERNEDLQAGRNFQIIELNGASAEATSIYDARHSLGAAYRTLFRQWELVFAIGAANRARGCAPTRLDLLWRRWRENVAVTASYPPAD